MSDSIIQIKSLPGIKRDGTVFEGDAHVDGQWCRWQRALPRKMGGYRSINKHLRDIARTLHTYTRDLLTYVHAGSANALERFYIDGSNNTSIIYNRTPVTLVADDRNLWQFDVDTVPGSSDILLVAQVAPNLDCICNSHGGQLFYGGLFGTDTLTEVTALPTGYSATGGVVSLHPYTFVFGNEGYIMWSPDPTDFTVSGAGYANITGQKLLRGMPLRSGGGPSGLFWSADSLLRATFLADTATFQFDTISAQTSILSAQSVIEYDGVFYWIGTDRFLMFNGVVREVENQLNQNFFFDNVNYAMRQKVFAFKVPRYGEIWWCFPKYPSTEPNWAVIHNVRENTWYDTELPNDGRSAAMFAAVFRRPLAAGLEPSYNDTIERLTEAGDERITEAGDTRLVEESDSARYKLWVHEIGTDEVDGTDIRPIRSFFETADITLATTTQVSNALQVKVIEPDFVQSGDLTVRVKGRINARAPEITGDEKTITETAADPGEEVVFALEQRRQLRFRFESNCVGGDYQMGHVLAHVQPADARYKT